MSLPIREAKVTDRSLNLTNFNQMVTLVNQFANCTVDQNMILIKSATGFHFGIRKTTGGAGLDMTHIDFGYDITDTTARKVSFNPGVFRMGQSHFTVPASADVIINSSPAYIYLEYLRGAAAATLMPPTANINLTIPDANAYRHLFYTFTISDSDGLEEPTIHHLGGVFVGAYWA
jgi:hypothetical protein